MFIVHPTIIGSAAFTGCFKKNRTDFVFYCISIFQQNLFISSSFVVNGMLFLTCEMQQANEMVFTEQQKNIYCPILI